MKKLFSPQRFYPAEPRLAESFRLRPLLSTSVIISLDRKNIVG